MPSQRIKLGRSFSALARLLFFIPYVGTWMNEKPRLSVVLLSHLDGQNAHPRHPKNHTHNKQHTITYFTVCLYCFDIEGPVNPNPNLMI